MATDATLVWFRLDLRLGDNPALDAACRRGGPVVPVFVYAPGEEGDWSPGAASRWWLHQSLAALEKSLRQTGSRLIIREGPSLKVLLDLAGEVGAGAVHWGRRYEPALVARDAAVKAGLEKAGLTVTEHPSSLLFEPERIRKKTGGPFQVFTPFWRTCCDADEPARPCPAPASLPRPPEWPPSVALDRLELEPKIDWAAGLRATWQPGESGARKQLASFLEDGLTGYARERDRPAKVGSSMLSPHLHFGEISPRTVWHAVREQAAATGSRKLPKGAETFLKEFGWREFSHHLLVHFPDTPTEPLKPPFARFPWRDDPIALRAWQRGRTGFPLVDAGMRQLWHTGWMHNRVRMVVASFLVKHLLLPWQAGARWFWDTLVDADLANNTLGWQWTAGCGADAAPYFRVFNPVAQGQRFDPDGDYIRRWVPELKRLPHSWIHWPADAPAAVLARAGVDLGVTYPEPIVNAATARQRALDAYRQIQGRRKA